MKQRMKLLIGYDGSDCAEAALDDLQRAGLPSEAEALVMTVADISLPPPPPSSFEIVEQAREVHVPSDLRRIEAEGSLIIREARSVAERAVARLRANFPGWGITQGITLEAAVGSPARSLVKKANEWKSDLIVVGSLGQSALERFVLGSVSKRVLSEARCLVRVGRGRVEDQP